MRTVGKELQIRWHRLPHWQIGGSVYAVDFRTLGVTLHPEARRIVCKHISHDHGRRYELYIGLVMPNHVHLILQPVELSEGKWYDLGDITRGIRGSSSRSVNKLLKRKGPLWQEEPFDRIVRDEEELKTNWENIMRNPVDAGLVEDAQDYEFFVFPPSTTT